jgi:hypothetical protein
MEGEDLGLTLDAMRFDLSRAHERLHRLETSGYVLLLVAAVAALYWLTERRVL